MHIQKRESEWSVNGYLHFNGGATEVELRNDVDGHEEGNRNVEIRLP